MTPSVFASTTAGSPIRSISRPSRTRTSDWIQASTAGNP